MHTDDNKTLLQNIFARMAAGDTNALSDAMADEFRWTFPGNWSWSRSWGPKSTALHGLLRPLMSQFTEYRIMADAIHADGDRVVVQAHSAAVTTRGSAYDQVYCFVFTVADGLLTEVVEYCDTALVERVLEPLRPA
ncbi:nuclear transport factor 2 family protein [Nocardia spumae]|uniref:nuclear transport factor 2 family protein n=1 Tax=Nocardia spumae TaxID=2887190 RepID=UPI001D144D1C|nr:nuclear transport factor 2 family protein [Nocardia spumae]